MSFKEDSRHKLSDKIIKEDDFHWSTEWVEKMKDGGYKNPEAKILYSKFSKVSSPSSLSASIL